MGEVNEGLQAGMIGRTLRMLVGAGLVIEGGRHLLGAGVLLLLPTVGVILAELVFYAAMHLLIVRFFGRVNPWIGAALAVMPVAAVFFLSDAPGRLGTLLFVGISLVATAWRADGGCEVMTLPGMLFGRRTHLVCLAFSPVDWAESRLSRRRPGDPGSEGR